MGLMDNFLHAMNIREYDDEYDSEDFYDEGEVVNNVVKKASSSKNDDSFDTDDSEKSKKYSQKVTPIRPVRKTVANGMEVCVIKPKSMEDAREITETLLANRTVVLNLEGLDVDIAQRIIDFSSGSTYAINGSLQKISNYIFIITPSSVDISGDFQEMLSGTFDVPPISHSSF